MSEEMPRLWWSPCWGAVVGRAKHFEALESRRYFDELPSDAVELKPVSDAPAAPVETEPRYITRHMEGKGDGVWEVVDLLGGGKYPGDMIFASAEENARQKCEERAAKLNAGCCKECGTPGVYWRPVDV